MTAATSSMGGETAPATSYTFAPEERAISREIAERIRFFSVAWIILGGFFGVFALLGLLNFNANALRQFVWWAGLLAQGIFARRAQLRFAEIGRGEGDDMTQTVEALRALERYYATVGVVLVVQVGTTIIELF